MDWFLYYGDLCHERAKEFVFYVLHHICISPMKEKAYYEHTYTCVAYIKLKDKSILIMYIIKKAFAGFPLFDFCSLTRPSSFG